MTEEVMGEVVEEVVVAEVVIAEVAAAMEAGPTAMVVVQAAMVAGPAAMVAVLAAVAVEAKAQVGTAPEVGAIKAEGSLAVVARAEATRALIRGARLEALGHREAALAALAAEALKVAALVPMTEAGLAAIMETVELGGAKAASPLLCSGLPPLLGTSRAGCPTCTAARRRR